MIFAGDWRRQARVCARLAEDFDDQHLAERLKLRPTSTPKPMKSRMHPPNG
jgi:hypothetical protein